MNVLLDSPVVDMLAEKQIGYFSLTMYKEGKPVISTCNHAEWLRFYWDQYSQDDPMKKYIFGSRLHVLPWSSFDVDRKAREYIGIRNELVSVNANITLLIPKNGYLTAVTLGTAHGDAHLINLLNKDLEPLLLIQKLCAMHMQNQHRS